MVKHNLTKLDTWLGALVEKIKSDFPCLTMNFRKFNLLPWR